MRAPIRSILLIAGLLIWAAVPALPKDERYRRDGKVAAYRAGSDDGYRLGLRDGMLDCRGGFRYGYRGRDNPRWDGRHVFDPRHRGEYRKGFQDGYRQGYREGFRSRDWGRIRPFHRFR